ncbi:MAG: DUF4190 domain-containing protein [Lachnospiraceae bacterium]|nr:DUF4190 domain-containing protein [Lachnospiraceae bacterium]
MDYQPIPKQMQDRNATMKTASFILGILGIILSCFYLFGFPCSATAIILGHLSKGDSMKAEGKGRTGMILGTIGLILSIVFLIMFTVFIVKMFLNSPEMMDEFKQQMDLLQLQNPGSL